jgi:hypothetical protein
VSSRLLSSRQLLAILLVSAIVLVPAMARAYQHATVQTTHEGSSFSHSSDSAPNKTTNVCNLALVWHLALRLVDVTLDQPEPVRSVSENLSFLFVASGHSLRAPPVPPAL